MFTLKQLLKRVINIIDIRKKIHQYLNYKINTIAPNLSILIGAQAGARIIRLAGSIQQLAKYKTTFLRFLAGEKNLLYHISTNYNFNAIQHDLIFRTLFIWKNKERIEMKKLLNYIANKCAIAARIDAFMEGFLSVSFGKKLKEQVERRIATYFRH